VLCAAQFLVPAATSILRGRNASKPTIWALEEKQYSCHEVARRLFVRSGGWQERVRAMIQGLCDQYSHVALSRIIDMAYTTFPDGNPLLPDLEAFYRDEGVL
jgi:hypothetical protein